MAPAGSTITHVRASRLRLVLEQLTIGSAARGSEGGGGDSWMLLEKEAPGVS